MSLGETVSLHEGSLLWTLEEIGRLVSHSGSPAETLTNIVHLIQQRFDTDVCSVYLLEPDRAEPGAGRDDRPAARERRPRPHAADRRAGRPGRRADASRRSSPTPPRHPRFKYFREAGEDPYHSFLGVPLIDRGLLQGVLVVQTIEPRIFSAATTCGCW